MNGTPQVMTQKGSRLQDKLGYFFRHPELLERALTHRSAANERNGSFSQDNEQLEFLGDSILGFLVSDFLFQAFSSLSEGELSKTRAHLVSSANLFRIATQLELGDFLHLGKGEEKTGGRKKQALLVNAFEALVAAIYLDGGLHETTMFVKRCFHEDLEALETGTFFTRDFKSQLQERLQALRFPPAEYSVIKESGPDHKKLFSVELKVSGKKLTEGHGETKKRAEQEAARLALENILRQPN